VNGVGACVFSGAKGGRGRGTVEMTGSFPSGSSGDTQEGPNLPALPETTGWLALVLRPVNPPLPPLSCVLLSQDLIISDGWNLQGSPAFLLPFSPRLRHDRVVQGDESAESVSARGRQPQAPSCPGQTGMYKRLPNMCPISSSSSCTGKWAYRRDSTPAC